MSKSFAFSHLFHLFLKLTMRKTWIHSGQSEFIHGLSQGFSLLNGFPRGELLGALATASFKSEQMATPSKHTTTQGCMLLWKSQVQQCCQSAFILLLRMQKNLSRSNESWSVHGLTFQRGVKHPSVAWLQIFWGRFLIHSFWCNTWYLSSSVVS